MIPFSRRTAIERTPSAFEVASRVARASMRPLADLTVSNPTSAGLPELSTAALAELGGAGALSYAPAPRGSREARAAVADAVGADPDQLVLTASSSEAYALLFKLLCDPGDAVLAPTPSYPLFEHLARFDGVDLVPYPLAYDGEWWPSLPPSVDDRIKAILVVSPNNPTGTVFGAGDWERVRQLDRPVIVDEVFADYPLEGGGSAGAPTDLPLRFVLGGLSKAAGLPQMKLGWIRVLGDAAAATEALERLEILADTYLSVGTPVQVAAPALLAHRHPFQEAVGRRTRRNLECLRQVTAGTTLSVPRVDGGWYATVRVPATRSDEAWALALLEAGVRVQPGYLYDLQPGQWLVVSLLTPEASFYRGVRILADLIG